MRENTRITQLGQRDAARDIYRAKQDAKHARRWTFSAPQNPRPAVKTPRGTK